MAKGVRPSTKAQRGKAFGRPRARSRTRANKPKLVDDTDASEKVLRDQLASMGLYASPTIGDGNCLFRALSDQLYGSGSQHERLRHDICEFVSRQPDRYRLFVDEDSVPGGFEGHVSSMRRLGTYGTHIELSAFAHLFRRSVKVFQPGLIYIIQHDEGPPDLGTSITAGVTQEEKGMIVESARSARLRERKLRTKEKEMATKVLASAEGRDVPLCIVYHSWEHYSSLRNLAGPHSGMPLVREHSSSTAPSPPLSPRQRSKTHLPPPSPTSSLPSPSPPPSPPSPPISFPLLLPIPLASPLPPIPIPPYLSRASSPASSTDSPSAGSSEEEMEEVVRGDWREGRTRRDSRVKGRKEVRGGGGREMQGGGRMEGRRRGEEAGGATLIGKVRTLFI